MLSPTNNIYEPDEEHVRSVRYLLLNFLPLELVDLIIDEARYWAYVRSECFEQIEASAWDSPDNRAIWCYLVSPPVPGNWTREAIGDVDSSVQRKAKVRMVVFELQSHDQGWGGNPHLRGTRNGSWTWFEAAIIRASDGSKLEWLETALSCPVNLQARSSSAAFADPSLDPRWHIESNLTAVSQKQSHSVIWTRQEFQRAQQKAESSKGREGLGYELVRALQAGDRVAVLAMAQFPGWSNHVYSGSVTIYYSV